jgi:hypothetical protein
MRFRILGRQQLCLAQHRIYSLTPSALNSCSLAVFPSARAKLSSDDLVSRCAGPRRFKRVTNAAEETVIASSIFPCSRRIMPNSCWAKAVRDMVGA